jgi:hypothetical protein
MMKLLREEYDLLGYITPCISSKANQLFGETCRFHFQGDLLATCFHAGFVLGLFFDPENGGDIFLRNIRFE